MSGSEFIDPAYLGLTPKKLADLFREDDEDERTPEQEAWDRRYEAEKVEAAWRAEGSSCDADPGMGHHVGNPCSGCGREVIL